MLILISAVPLLSQEIENDYLRGKAEGKKAAKTNAAWFLAGIGCGVFGVIAAYAVTGPDSPSEYLVGKFSDYARGFVESYKKQSKKKNGSAACSGMILTMGVVSLLTAMSSANSLQ